MRPPGLFREILEPFHDYRTPAHIRAVQLFLAEKLRKIRLRCVHLSWNGSNKLTCPLERTPSGVESAVKRSAVLTRRRTLTSCPEHP